MKLSACATPEIGMADSKRARLCKNKERSIKATSNASIEASRCRDERGDEGKSK